MKIVYLLVGSHLSGGQRVVWEHVTRLRERGHDAGILLMDGGTDFWLPHDGLLRTPDDLSDADVIIATSALIAPALHNFATAARRMYFVQSRESLWRAPDSPKIIHKLEETYELATLEVFTIAEHLRNFLRDEYGRGDVPIIPNGVNREQFNPNVERLPCGDKPVVLVEGARHSAAKDTQGIVEQVLAKARETLDFEVWLLTHDNRYAVGEQMRFERPAQDLIPRIYATADALLKASQYEGRPCPVAEAQACGTPVVYMGRYGRDDVANNLIDYDDVEAGAQALISALSGNSGYIKEPPQWDASIDKLEALLKEPPGAWKDAQEAELAWWEWYQKDELVIESPEYWRGMRAAQFRQALDKFGLERDDKRGRLPAGKWLDAGSGPSSYLQGLDYVAIDPLADQYLDSDVIKVTIEDHAGEYDNVWCYNVLDHAYDWRKALHNLMACTKSGGELWLFTDCRKPHQLDAHHKQAFAARDVLRIIQGLDWFPPNGWEIIYCNIQQHSIRGAIENIAIRAVKP